VDTTFAPTTTSSASPSRQRWLAVGVIATFACVALVLAISSRPATSPTDLASGNTGISAQQLVTRAEIADRYGVAGTSGLSPQQIVTRSEVSDRYDIGGRSDLSPQQIVVRGEVADRYAR
jgi:hypothetical protein